MGGTIHAEMQWENVTFHQQAIEEIVCSKIKNHGKTVKYVNKKTKNFFDIIFQINGGYQDLNFDMK